MDAVKPANASMPAIRLRSYEKSHSCGIILVAKNDGVWYVAEMLQNDKTFGRPDGYVPAVDIGAKGEMLPGETERQTAMRELFEETGLQGFEPVGDFKATEGPYLMSRWDNGRPTDKVEKTITYYLSIVPYYVLEEIRLSREHIAYSVNPLSMVIGKLNVTSPKRAEILAEVREYLLTRDIKESKERRSLDDVLANYRLIFGPEP